MQSLLCATLAVLLAVTAPCKAEADNVVKEIEALKLTTLLSALKANKLDTALADAKSNFTVFGPTDDALKGVTGVSADILKYHVIPATVLSSDLTNEQTASTLLADKDVRVNIYKNEKNESTITVQCSPVTMADKVAKNGVVHVISKVLPVPSGTIAEVAEATEGLSTLFTAVAKAGLGDVLNGTGPFTVFAPTNAAFAKIDNKTLDDLLNDKEKLTAVLKYHVVGSTQCSAGLVSGDVKTINGKTVKVAVGTDGVKVNDAKVTAADVSVTNGVVHLIDTVLFPPADPKKIPEEAKDLGLTSLLKAVTDAGLVDALNGKGPLTVFGPTNDAFKKIPAITNVTLLAEVLKFHVLGAEVMSKDLKNELTAPTLAGKDVRINIYKKDNKDVYTAQCARIDITRVDQKASNGLVHVLNDVMIPPMGNIAEVAAANDDLSALVQIVQVAGLLPVVSGKGPFTVFAPSNKAFAALSEGDKKKILGDKKLLVEVLKTHIVPSTQCSAGLSSGDVVTASSKKVKVTVSSKGVQINDANVITADVSATNGVIHIIDKVLYNSAGISAASWFVTAFFAAIAFLRH